MTYISPWSDGIKPAGNNITNLDVKSSSLQRTVLQAISKGGQLVLDQKAAMDEATYLNIAKSGSNYNLINGAAIAIPDEIGVVWGDTGIQSTRVIGTTSLKTISMDIRTNHINDTMTAMYQINGGSDISIGFTHSVTYVTVSISNVSLTVGDTLKLKASHSGGYNAWAYAKNGIVNPDNAAFGTIISALISKNTSIGLRYWMYISANLVAGKSDNIIKARICDSTGTPLHSNFVTIPATEYTRIPLERPVVLTSTGNSQTVWNFTSLSNTDAFINELGVLAKALMVELALDGTNYMVLNEGTNFNEDISNILAPKITLVSGTGVINAISKLRATYIVNIPLSNTTIKMQIQLNRVAGGDTSPSIQPLIGDASKYVSAGQMAII